MTNNKKLERLFMCFKKTHSEAIEEEKRKISELYDGNEVDTLFRSKKLYFDEDKTFSSGLPDGCPMFNPGRERSTR